MALQVVVCKEVKRGTVGIIDLMNKGLRLLSFSGIFQRLLIVGIIDLMNKGLRLKIKSNTSINLYVGIIDLMNKGLRPFILKLFLRESLRRNH